MKKLNNKDDLMINLPDYINNNLEDKNIIEQIEFEIENNPDFKDTYEKMKYSLDFMRETEFDSPPDNYFVNLVPRINQRIEQSKNKIAFVWFGKVIPYWKYAVPVTLLVLFLLLYNIDFRGNKVNIAPSDELSNTIQELNQDNKIEESNLTDSLDEALTDIISDDEVNTTYTPTHTVYYQVEKNHEIENPEKGQEIKNGLIGDNPEIFDNIDDETLSPAGVDLMLDNDLNKMTPEQQKKILIKLKNSDF